jgi:hypothetical protein
MSKTLHPLPENFADLGWQLQEYGVPQAIVDATIDAVRAFLTTREQLLRGMNSLAAKMADDARLLNAWPARHVNELGEVQGRGRDIDSLCAQLEQQRRWVVTLASICERQTPEEVIVDTGAMVQYVALGIEPA